MSFDLKNITSSASGMDAFFETNPEIVTPLGQKIAKANKPIRVKVGSLNDLQGFVRTAEDTLISKATHDLWSLQKDDDGYYVERMFDANGGPLKG